jgi:CheY-like chemotaxis protein
MGFMMEFGSASLVKQTPFILIVEDSDEDFEVLRRFLQKSSMVVSSSRCVNGEQALAFLYRIGKYQERQSSPCPSLIILDLNLPGTDGRDVLRRVKQDNKLKTIPVVIFTTSSNPKDIEECYEYGANGYIVKPLNFDQLKQVISTLLDYWLQVIALPNYREI